MYDRQGFRTCQNCVESVRGRETKKRAFSSSFQLCLGIMCLQSNTIGSQERKPSFILSFFLSFFPELFLLLFPAEERSKKGASFCYETWIIVIIIFSKTSFHRSRCKHVGLHYLLFTDLLLSCWITNKYYAQIGIVEKRICVGKINWIPYEMILKVFSSWLIPFLCDKDVQF